MPSHLGRGNGCAASGPAQRERALRSVGFRLAPASAAAHPDDWRAWWLEVQARRAARADDPAIASAATRACTLIALNPAVRAPPDLCAAKGAQASSR